MNCKAQEKHKRPTENPSNCKVVPTDYTRSHLNKQEFKIVLAEMKMPKLHSSQTIPVTVIVSIPEFLSKRNSKAFPVQAVHLKDTEIPTWATQNFYLWQFWNLLSYCDSKWFRTVDLYGIYFDNICICTHISILPLYFKNHKTMLKLRSVISLYPRANHVCSAVIILSKVISITHSCRKYLSATIQIWL